MAQPELGTKRQCASCGANFYDLQRDPVVCPICEAKFKSKAAPRSRATAAVAEVADAEASPVIDAKNVEVVVDAKDVEIVVDATGAKPDTEASGEADAGVVEEDGDTSGLIEDASELGEDADDMAEVMAASSKDDDER